MKRINAKKDCEMSDSEMAEGLHGLDIPHIDLGDQTRTVRYEDPDGQIIDEVVQPGEREQSFSLESPDVTARQNGNEIKRRKDIQSGNRYETI